MRRMKLALTVAGVLLLTSVSSVRGDSIFGSLVELSLAMKQYLADDVYVVNNSNRITSCHVRKGDGTWIGSTGVIGPYSLSSEVDGAGVLDDKPNPYYYEIKGYVLNEKTGQWVDKTGWVRIKNPDPYDNLEGNPGDDLYFEFFKNSNGVWKIRLL